MADTVETFNEALQDIDIRSVALVWGDGEPGPELLISENTSVFEAAGYLRGALKKLERMCDKAILWKDEDDDEDDDDDFA